MTMSSSTKRIRAGHGAIPKRRPRPAHTPPRTRSSRGRTKPCWAKLWWMSFMVRALPSGWCAGSLPDTSTLRRGRCPAHRCTPDSTPSGGPDPRGPLQGVGQGGPALPRPKSWCVYPESAGGGLGVGGGGAEVDHDAGLVADHPGVMSGFDAGHRVWSELAFAAVVHPHPHPPREHVEVVGGLTAVRTHDRPQVLRPPPSGLELALEDDAAAHVHHLGHAFVGKGTRLVGVVESLRCQAG